jgi:hypothetical protein
MIEYSTIATRLAATLLESRGEISLSEIRALPLVDDDDVAVAIADILARDYDVQRYERRARQSPVEVENVLRLATLTGAPSAMQ